MDLVALQKKLEARYLGYTDTSVTPNVVVPALDTEILSHAVAYFRTAQRLYELDDDGSTDASYPMLTLLAFSAELFLKGFHPKVKERYEVIFQEDSERETGDKSIKILKDKKVYSSRKERGLGHDLGMLLESHLDDDEDLYNYLTGRYTIDTGRNLLADLSDYSNTFKQVRYIFEHGKTKGRQYLNDINIIYRLVESLYKSSTTFYTVK